MPHFNPSDLYQSVSDLPPFVQEGLEKTNHLEDPGNEETIVNYWRELNMARREHVIEELEGYYSVACYIDETTDELRLCLLLNRLDTP